MIKAILLVGAGGFAGSTLRYLASLKLGAKTAASFPLGTFCVNIAGSLLLGILIGLWLKGVITSDTRLLLATGFCGGFTTFSAFSWELLIMLQHGEHGLALFYLLLSIAGGLLAAWGGVLLAGALTG